MNKEQTETCYYRGKEGFRPKGWGYCKDCTQNNDENLHCKGYTPIRLYVIEVKERDCVD